MKRRIRTDSGVCGPMGLGRLWSGSASRKLAAALGWGGVHFGFAGGFLWPCVGPASDQACVSLASLMVGVELACDCLSSALDRIRVGFELRSYRLGFGFCFIWVGVGVRWLCFGSGVGRLGIALGRIGCQFGCAMCWLGRGFALLAVGFLSV